MTNCCNISTVLFTVSRRPTRKQLQRYVSPPYAAHWREIGEKLGLPNGKLSEIRADNPKCKMAFNEMLAEWLNMDDTASWKKLFDALESSALLSRDEGNLSIVASCPQTFIAMNMYELYV